MAGKAQRCNTVNTDTGEIRQGQQQLATTASSRHIRPCAAGLCMPAACQHRHPHHSSQVAGQACKPNACILVARTNTALMAYTSLPPYPGQPACGAGALPGHGVCGTCIQRQPTPP